MSHAACQIGSYTEWLNGFQSAVGFGRMNAATMPGSFAARRNSAARELDVLLRQQRGTEQLALTLAHVVGQPVVVRTALRVREADVGVGLDPEELRGIQHRHVDVVGAHVVEPCLGVVRRGPHLGVAQLAPHRTLAVLVAHARGAGDRGAVGGAAHAVPHQPLGRRRRRSRCARCDLGTPLARSRPCRSGARGRARRSRRNEARSWRPWQSPFGSGGGPPTRCARRSTRAMLPRG